MKTITRNDIEIESLDPQNSDQISLLDYLRKNKLWKYSYLRWIELVAFAFVFVLASYVHFKGAKSFPPPLNDDEGTYVARAWAVFTGRGPHNGPAPYTYWYDHPPVGWIQIAIWAFFTNMFHNGALLVVQSARQLMGYYFMADLILTYYIARKFKFGIVASFVSIAVLGFSPLSVMQMRLVLLDTIGVTWFLLAVAVLLGDKRKLTRAFAAGTIFGISVLSKETFLLLMPVLLLIIWNNTKPPVRRFALIAFLGSSAIIGTFYILFAALRGELFPGPGHTSLIHAVIFQLFSRKGSGSIFNVHSARYKLVFSWVTIDPLITIGGTIGGLICLFDSKIRPIGVGILAAIGVLLETGYMPIPFIIGYIPLLALALGGAIAILNNSIWNLSYIIFGKIKFIISKNSSSNISNLYSKISNRQGTQFSSAVYSFTRWSFFPIVIAIFLATSFTSQWQNIDQSMMTTNTWKNQLNAEKWIIKNVPKSDSIIVDDYFWTDLVLNGYPMNHVVWFWVFGTDPMVNARFPNGFKSVNYLVSTVDTRTGISQHQSGISKPFRIYNYETKKIIQFGSGKSRITIRKVIK